MAGKRVKFSERGGDYFLLINNTALISATVTFSVEWEHADGATGDPVGKVVVKGSDGVRHEIYTNGKSGSKSVTFPIEKSYGSEYPVKFDKKVNAKIKEGDKRIFLLRHPEFSEQAAKDAIFLKKKDGKWGVKIPEGIEEGSVITLFMARNDRPSDAGTALDAVETPSYNGTNRMEFNNVQKDEDTETVPVKSSHATFYPFNLQGLEEEPKRNEGAKDWKSGEKFPPDVRLEFFDRDGDDVNAYLYIQKKKVVVNSSSRIEGARITISLSDIVMEGGTTIPDDDDDFDPVTLTCDPGPWKFFSDDSDYNEGDYVAPVFPDHPPGSSGGLICKKAGDKNIILDLKNYRNKLVTIRVDYTVPTGSWPQGFDFSIPNASDIYIGDSRLGGNDNEYNFPSYSHKITEGSKIFKFYNLDGGHEYEFVHSHEVGEEPQRERYVLKCTEVEHPSEDIGDGETGTVVEEVCECIIDPEQPSETWTMAGGRWPRFDSRVSVQTSGGNEVSWVYEDGSGSKKGGLPDDVQVNVTVVKVRDTVPWEGALRLKGTLEALAWLDSTTAAGAVVGAGNNFDGVNGESLADYYEHSDKIRIRVPSQKRSLTNLQQGGADMSEFRGAGAAPYEAF